VVVVVLTLEAVELVGQVVVEMEPFLAAQTEEAEAQTQEAVVVEVMTKILVQAVQA
jgi:hypothetical protein